MAGNTFYQQISANRRNSFLMALFVVVLLGLLGFAIGYVFFGSAAGGLFTTVGASGSGPSPVSARTSRGTSSSWR